MYRPARRWLLLALGALLGGMTGTAQASDPAPSDPAAPPGTGPPLAATVLGEEVRTDDAGEMQAIVLGRLFDRYAEQQGISVTDAEIDAFVEHMRRGMRAAGLGAEDDLSAKEAARVDETRR